MSEQERAKMFEYIFHLHRVVSDYAFLKTFEDLLLFENHIVVLLADHGFIDSERGREVAR
jgi:hypothetical protein